MEVIACPATPDDAERRVELRGSRDCGLWQQRPREPGSALLATDLVAAPGLLSARSRDEDDVSSAHTPLAELRARSAGPVKDPLTRPLDRSVRAHLA